MTFLLPTWWEYLIVEFWDCVSVLRYVVDDKRIDQEFNHPFHRSHPLNDSRALDLNFVIRMVEVEHNFWIQMIFVQTLCWFWILTSRRTLCFMMRILVLGAREPSLFWLFGNLRGILKTTSIEETRSWMKGNVMKSTRLQKMYVFCMFRWKDSGCTAGTVHFQMVSAWEHFTT